MKKIATLLLTLSLVFCMLFAVSVNASADSTVTQDGLEVTITTDKAEYAKNDDIQVTVSIKNTNTFKVEDVSVETLLPEGLVLKTGDLAAKDIAIEAGESYTASVVAQLSEELRGEESKPEEGPVTPPAGDSSDIVLWMVLVAAAAICAVAVLRNKQVTKTFCLLLCFAIAITMIPVNAFATESETVTKESVSVTVDKAVTVDGKAYNVTSKVTYAKKLFVITFDSNGGNEIPSQTVYEGACATRPAKPVKEGLSLQDWYVDSALTTAFDFSTPITGNITLYAKWRAIDNLEDEIIDIGDIEHLVSQGKIEVVYNEDGNVRIIDGTFTDEIIKTPEAAAELLNNASTLFGERFDASGEDFICGKTGAGTSEEENYFRYSPTKDGLYVLGSQIIIVTDQNGKVTGLFNSYDKKIDSVDTNATVNEGDAVNAALTLAMSSDEVVAFFESLQINEEDIEAAKAEYMASLNTACELMIYAADDDKDPALVYAVTVTGYQLAEQVATASFELMSDSSVEITESEIEVGTPIIDNVYFLYANGSSSGNLFKTILNTEGWRAVELEGIDLLDQTRTFMGQEEDGSYRLKDTTRDLITYKTDSKFTLFGGTEYIIPGNIAESFSFFGDERMNKAAVSVHANMTKVYDYYNDVLGRKSFDGNGATIKVSYDYGNNYNNAYWTSSGQQFVFGSGKDYVAALDIVGHEYTHAVINYVVGNGRSVTLTYFGETGALNEAYADIMGNLIEGKTGTDFWNHGEDKGSVTRSMANPTAYGQPDHYRALSDPDWDARLNGYEERDNEGVHIFGGVYCHAVYLMMSDSRCSNISQETWAKVFYRSLYRLTTDASFLDGRGAVICSAKALGFNHDQQQAIKDAFDAVGIVNPDEIRVVLQWGETPRDLDSHIVGPGVNGGSRFHVYWIDRNYYENGAYWSNDALHAVDLDYDDVTSFGPEVVTVHILTPGEYYYYVHDYTNRRLTGSTAMAQSGATVKVYRGPSNTPIAQYEIDPTSSGNHWNVFSMTVGEDGSVTIREIDTYGESAIYS